MRNVHILSNALGLTVHVRHLMENGEVASAKGAKLRLPKARNPLRLGGLGERRQLPTAPPPAPRADAQQLTTKKKDAILNILCQNGVHFWLLLISYFLTIKSKKASKPYRPMRKFHHII